MEIVNGSSRSGREDDGNGVSRARAIGLLCAGALLLALAAGVEIGAAEPPASICTTTQATPPVHRAEGLGREERPGHG